MRAVEGNFLHPLGLEMYLDTSGGCRVGKRGGEACVLGVYIKAWLVHGRWRATSCTPWAWRCTWTPAVGVGGVCIKGCVLRRG